MKKVKVKINKDGTVEVSTEGMSGSTCVKETEQLELLLGKAIGETEFTADYYKGDAPSEPWIKTI